MNNKLLAILLTGTAVISVGIGSGINEVMNNDTPQEEQVEAVQPIILVDEKCQEDSLLLRIGTGELCTSKEVYLELKKIVIDDLSVEDTTWQTAEGKECKEGEEGCLGMKYDINLGNRELFTAIMLKEMIKTGEIKALSEDKEEAKREALELLTGTISSTSNP